MSRKTRIAFAVIAALLVVAVVVLAQPDDSSDKADDPKAPVSRTAVNEPEPTATAPSAPEPAPMEIVLRDHEATEGVQTIEVGTGETIRFLVSSDVADEIHFHGYDLEKKVGPGKPARFEVKAKLEGIFEVESHEAEHAGKEALIAKVVVKPS